MRPPPAGLVIMTTSLICGVFWGIFACFITYVTGWSISPLIAGIIVGLAMTVLAIISLAVIMTAINDAAELPRP